MELDILKQNTTWNDASASINNNFAKVKTAIEQGGGGTGGGGGASIPVVSSEEELESLSQNKGELAVILSEDDIKASTMCALDLHQASTEELTAAMEMGLGFVNCDKINSISINTEIQVPPCLPLAGVEVQAVIAARDFSQANPKYLGLMFDAITVDGYLGAVGYVDLETYASGELAHYDAESGRMVVNDESLAVVNNTIASYGDAVWVALAIGNTSLGDGVDVELIEAIRNTFAFLECNLEGFTYGLKSIRVKGDEGYERLDSDVIKLIDNDKAYSINNLDMPLGSLVRVYVPEHLEYDTSLADIRCAIIEPEVDVSVCSVVNRVEFARHFTTTPNDDPDDYSNKPPFFTLVNADLTQSVRVRWWFGADILPIAVAYTQDGTTSVPLLENGVWYEDNIAALQEIIASGVNRVYELGKYGVGANSWSGTHLSIYDKSNGHLAEEYNTGEYSAFLGILITSHFTLYCNERLIEESVDEYERLDGKWAKKGVVTQWSESSATSNKPVAASLVYNTLNENFGKIYEDLDSKQPKLVSGENLATVNGHSLLEGGNIVIEGGEGGGSNITVDSALSTTSTNPVQNAVITTELNKKVNAESGKGLSTNDYTTAEKNKLAGIAANAEVNVQSDWNATSGDAFIKNKPTFATINGQRIDQGGEIVVEGGGSVEGAAKYYPIYDPEWQYGFTLSEEKIEANKAAYQAALAREEAVYYFDMEIKDAIVAVTDVQLIGEAVLFRCALVSEKFADDNIISRTERHITLGSDGVPDVSVQDIDFATKQYVDNLDETKQDTLVDGESIKTINGVSLLGKGNIQLGGAVIFDATCANDIYDLPELQTTTEVQTIIDAIATSQPIYAQFAVSMIPATIAYLANGFPHLLLQTVDAEDGKARMVHIYAYEGGWTWESFEMELGGAAGTFVKSVNGVTPDDNGNVQIEVTIDGEAVDTTLSTLVGSGSTFTLEELIG